MSDLTITSGEYTSWLADLKHRIQSAQQRATLYVNRELVLLYWQIGRDILERQQAQGWGAKVIERLVKDLTSAFPDMKVFSRRNPLYMLRFAEKCSACNLCNRLLHKLQSTRAVNNKDR